jgi:RNA polymerase sigma factor (sigma-70 family)
VNDAGPASEFCDDAPVRAARAGEPGPARWLEQRLGDALQAYLGPCHPPSGSRSSVGAMELRLAWWMSGDVVGAVPTVARHTDAPAIDVDALVVRLFTEEGASLVRLARLFVDDRNAAEDLVQEAFIRLARSAHRIDDVTRAPAYLRSIVLNLARDHNRRGLMSLRHQEPADVVVATTEDELVLREDQQRVLGALRLLPARQRDCVVLRYHFEAGIAEIADTLGISQNSVKTHLKRGLASLERHLAATTEVAS